MSAMTSMTTITQTGGTTTDTALVYTTPSTYGGVVELQVINLPQQDATYITAWTTKSTTSTTFDEAGVIWKNYVLTPNTSLTYNKLVLSSGEKVYISVANGTASNKIIVQLKGFIEPNG